MKTLIVLLSLFIALTPASYAQRSFLNTFKQDFLYRCTGIFSSSKASLAKKYAPLQLDLCGDTKSFEKKSDDIFKNHEIFRLLQKTAQNHDVQLRFVGKSQLDMTNYAINVTLAENAHTGLSKSAVNGQFDKIFPYAMFEQDIELGIHGDPTNIEQALQKLNSLFASLETPVKYYQNTDIDHLTLKVQDSVDLFSKTIQIESFFDELSTLDKKRATLQILELSSRYSLEVSDENISRLKNALEEFRGQEIDESVLGEFRDSMNRFFKRSADIESAISLLEKVDPENALSEALGEEYRLLASRKYLTSLKIGEGFGRTAESLGLEYVTHQTDQTSYYGMISNPQGKPSLRVSRKNAGEHGELAQRGEGFYAMRGVDSEFHPDYGDYKIVFKVHPDARVGSDFSLYNNEVLFHNLSALEIDIELSSKTIGPLHYFQRLSLMDDFYALQALPKEVKSISQEDLYRLRISVMSQVLTNPKQRAEVDALALEVFQGKKANFNFVQTYLSLPFLDTPLQRQAEQAFLQLMSDGLYEPMRTNNIGLLKIWLNSNRYNEHKDLIKEFIDRPTWNGDVLLGENIHALLGTKASEEQWVIDHLKNSKSFPEFQRNLENVYRSPEVKRLLSLLDGGSKKSSGSTGCQDLMSHFLR
jgi:hypothetical protein